jgi:aryl-alcohol dehydrogenase (NADP+)
LTCTKVHAYDPLTPLEETLRTLDQFVRAGKIRYWGLSNFTGWQLTKAVHLARALNVAGPVTLQPQYSLLAREIEWEIAPAALDAGTGLLPWSPLGGGWLSGKYKRDERPAGATASARIPTAVWKPMTGAARNAPGTSSTWCRRWPRIAACPWPRSRWRGCPAGPPSPRPSSGPRTMSQLETNLRSAQLHLTAAETAALDAASDPQPAGYPYGELGGQQRARSLPGGHWAQPLSPARA